MKKLFFVIIIAASFLTSQNACGQQVSTKNYNLKNGVAVQGYDPVAYFTDKGATEGKKEIQTEYNGVTYYFYSEENKRLFLTTPIKYEPAYGGYCAYAMAFGDKVKIDPKTFEIKNGRLFLFYNFKSNNTLLDWNKDEAKLFKDAEREWLKLIADH